MKSNFTPFTLTFIVACFSWVFMSEETTTLPKQPVLSEMRETAINYLEGREEKENQEKKKSTIYKTFIK